jgi:hypothetical protein
VPAGTSLSLSVAPRARTFGAQGADYPASPKPVRVHDRRAWLARRHEFEAPYALTVPLATREAFRPWTLEYRSASKTERDAIFAHWDKFMGGTFRWQHPRTGAVYRVRFARPIQEYALTRSRPHRYDFDVALEEAPITA